MDNYGFNKVACNECFNAAVNVEEKIYLRNLAKKHVAFSNDQRMRELEQLWDDHNSLKGTRPVISVDDGDFIGEMLPVTICLDPVAQELERFFHRWFINYSIIRDDKVLPPYFPVYIRPCFDEFGIRQNITTAIDGTGRSFGFHIEPVIKVISEDFQLLQRSKFEYNMAYAAQKADYLREIIGDILPVKVINSNLTYNLIPTKKVVNLMGQENMLIAMMDEPDEFHALMSFVTDDMIAYVDWLEGNNLLSPNNTHEPVIGGCLGLCAELDHSGKTLAKNMWVNTNSQATIGVSPAMFKEFVLPYYKKICSRFGLSYYGCCEPVHDYYTDCLDGIPHLRKISISAWCNEAIMSEKLAGSKIIYSRKPTPNFFMTSCFDEEAFSEYMGKSAEISKKCRREVIFRDILMVAGGPKMIGKAVEITRDLFDAW